MAFWQHIRLNAVCILVAVCGPNNTLQNDITLFWQILCCGIYQEWYYFVAKLLAKGCLHGMLFLWTPAESMLCKQKGIIIITPIKINSLNTNNFFARYSRLLICTCIYLEAKINITLSWMYLFLQAAANLSQKVPLWPSTHLKWIARP